MHPPDMTPEPLSRKKSVGTKLSPVQMERKSSVKMERKSSLKNVTQEDVSL